MTTYYARKEYIYDTGDTIFGIPFSYIKPEHIVVLINGEDTKNYTYLNSTQIRITNTLKQGDKITIARTTPIKDKMVEFSNTSILDKTTQNLAQTQIFNAVQEIYDNNEVFKEESNGHFQTIIEKNRQEILDIQTGFEKELNSEFQTVKDAADKINTLDDAIGNTQNAANTAIEKANEAKETVDNAIQNIENTANKQAATIKQMGADELSKITQSGIDAVRADVTDLKTQVAAKANMTDVTDLKTHKANMTDVWTLSTVGNVSIPMSWGASGSKYYAPSNGKFFLEVSLGNSNEYIRLYCTKNGVSRVGTGNVAYVSVVDISVDAGDEVILFHNISKDPTAFKFVQANGD